MKRRLLGISIVVLVGALLVLLLPTSGRPPSVVQNGSSIGWHTTSSPPIDPRQADIPFGYRSQWLQPWRGYLDTPPATTLRDGLGINFNPPTQGPLVADTLRLLARSGIRRARIELPWNAMDYEHPAQLSPAELPVFRAELLDMKQLGIRPLILLNSNSGGPTPSVPLPIRLVRPALAGSRTIVVDSSTARQIVPGRSGLDAPALQAGTLFTAVGPGGVVRVSKPLASPLAAGAQAGSTLRYAPFAPPVLLNGTPNPVFRQTMNGWLTYVAGVARWVKSTLGDTKFDLEVWNELSFGSEFLSQNAYYAPLPPGKPADLPTLLLADTVRYLRNPSLGLADVAITDGFASQTPFPAGSTSPPGLSALSKHPYQSQPLQFPQNQLISAIRPLDARAQPDYSGGATTSDPARDHFIPHYDAFFPEYYLSALQTETLTRDLSPQTSEIYGVRHGRFAAPAGGNPVGVWLTEMGTDLSRVGLRPQAAGETKLGAGDREHILAKATLRTYSAFINKGVSAVYLYAAFSPQFGLVDDAFVNAAAAGRAPPESGGVVLDALRRFAGTLADAQPIMHHRPLRLEQIADREQRVQFRGDGTAGHPSLYDRDVLAFLPFQLSTHSWIAPTYVMTRDIVHAYRGGTSPTRFDLPGEPFRIRVGGVDARTARVSLYDPLSNKAIPARIVTRSLDTVTIQLQVTDSPRMLRITDG